MNNKVIVVCPHCEKKYTLGKDGTVEGCDVCLKIIRNLDGTVIEDSPLVEVEQS